MPNKSEFTVENDALYRFTPTGENTGIKEIVIDKETFIKCYKLWVEGWDGDRDHRSQIHSY